MWIKIEERLPTPLQKVFITVENVVSDDNAKLFNLQEMMQKKKITNFILVDF